MIRYYLFVQFSRKYRCAKVNFIMQTSIPLNNSKMGNNL